MSSLNANEQLMLELINRARLDPAAEASRQHISLNEGVPSYLTITTKSMQVLAGNDILVGTARHHSQYMLDHADFSRFEGFDSFGYRMDVAGYGGIYQGENISWYGTKGALDATAAITKQFNSMFVDNGYDGRGHRTNIMNAKYSEVGIGQELGNYNGMHASMITQDFGLHNLDPIITGVVYRDTVKNDNFFSVGEQRAGVTVIGHNTNSSTPDVSDTTGAGGGYEMTVAPRSGKWTVSFGTDLDVAISVNTNNVKLDFVNGKEVWTTSSATSLSEKITALFALGQSNTSLTGSAANEHITGNKGSNTLQGNQGNDTITGGAGADKLTGGLDDDQFVYAKTTDAGITSSSRDTITDFDQFGNDVIDLHSFSGTYTYRGTSAFNGAHQVRVTSDKGGVTVHISTDTDHTDELQIFLAGAHISDMSKSDFIL